MNERKPWRPQVRGLPIFNPFEPSTDWTRDIGANDRAVIPAEEETTDSADRDIETEGGKPSPSRDESA